MLCGVQDLLLIYEIAMVEVGRVSLQGKSLSSGFIMLQRSCRRLFGTAGFMGRTVSRAWWLGAISEFRNQAFQGLRLRWIHIVHWTVIFLIGFWVHSTSFGRAS